jgi:signal transduction histidine kinase
MPGKISILLFLLLVACLHGSAQSFARNRQMHDSLAHLLQIAKDDTSKVNAMVAMADAFSFSEPDSALYYGLKALIMARRIRYLKGEQWALFYIGFTHEGQENFPEAMHAYLEALNVAEKTGITDAKGFVLQRVGFIYRSVNDFPNAIRYTLESMYLLDSVHNNELSIISQIHLADIYSALNNMDSAYYFARLAYDNMNKFNAAMLKTQTLFFMANIFKTKGKEKEAEKYFREALASAYSDTTEFKTYNSAHEIAQLHQLLNDPDSAAFYAKKSLADAQRGRLYLVIIKASNILSSIYKDKDPAKALAYTSIAADAKDSLSLVQKTNGLQNVVGFDAQERQFEIDTAKTAYENKVKMFILTTSLAVFLVIVILLYRNYRLKHRSNKILEKTLADLRATQAQLVQSEKMASLGELTAGIGHEIKNPLNFVNNFSDLANELLLELKSGPLENLSQEEKERAMELVNGAIESLQKVIHHGKRADGIVKAMLQHSRPSTGHKELTDINALADEYLRLSYHGLQEKDSSFKANISTSFDKNIERIYVVPQDLGRVFQNVYTNALYSVIEKKKQLKDGFIPSIAVSTRKSAEKIEVRIRDNGLGMPKSIMDKIFRPFFTTKPTGEGTGLGLSLSYDVIKAHGGEIKVESSEGEWAEFIIEIPAKLISQS